jgi:predicted AAA+ superfamily ATPase
MKKFWEACKFSDEIVSGDLKLYKFAVELHEFLNGQADPVYQDPELFFKNTFLTSQMELTLRDSLLRLSKGSGTPVIVI